MMNFKFKMMEWTTIKPKFTEECILITADIFHNRWLYSIYTIREVDFEGKCYWGLCDGDGDEIGNLTDLKSNLYLILPIIPDGKKLKDFKPQPQFQPQP